MGIKFGVDEDGDKYVDKLTRILTDEELDKVYSQHGKWIWISAADKNRKLRSKSLVDKSVDDKKQFVKFTIILTGDELQSLKKLHGDDIYSAAKECNSKLREELHSLVTFKVSQYGSKRFDKLARTLTYDELENVRTEYPYSDGYDDVYYDAKGVMRRLRDLQEKITFKLVDQKLEF